MDDDQEKLLQQASNIVKNSGFAMQRSFDSNSLSEVLKHSVDLISELKTSSMGPKTYYELYMQVFDQLSRLESYFMQEYRKSGKIGEMFEKVQHVQAILPRLYLLVAVGSVYINTGEVTAKDMLKDLMEMVKGVQHPIRGLFLRYYLNKMSKDKLPDLHTDQTRGTVDDSIEFLLNNFSEMCRLWVRMQHTGGIKDKAKREKERNDLKVTVGENIVRLSSLEGITLEAYTNVVLPRSLEVILSSKDAIAQQYLMDCMIQAFPDNYHLHNLNALLETTTQLQPSVEIKGIFINLLNRISDYAGETDLEIVQSVDIFKLIKVHTDKLTAENSPAGELSKFLQLFVAFLRLSLKCYPNNLENVISILNDCVNLIEKEDSGKHLDTESLNCIAKLLMFPLDSLGLAVLEIRNFPKLMSFLQFSARKKVALRMVKAVVNLKIYLTSEEVVKTLLDYISSLLADLSDTVEADPYEFEEEQEFTARLPHMVASENPSEVFLMLQLFREGFMKGGDARQVYTYPALIFAFIRLAGRVSSSEELNLSQIVSILYGLVSRVCRINPELGYKLSLQCALCIDLYDREKELEEKAYEFAADSLVIFQDNLTDQEAKINAIKIITSTYAHFECFDEENRITLYLNCAQFASKGIRRNEQVQGNLLASRLFWCKGLQDEDRAKEYLNRGLKLAVSEDNGKGADGLLHVLNGIIYLGVFGVENIESKDVADAIKKKMNDGNKEYYKTTVSYIKSKQAQGKLKALTY
jgi:vacuolar protein sorting-associated protein 35